MRSWSASADDKLRALYADTELARLAFLLKRSESALKQRARKLGLKRRRFWTAAEIKILRKRYPTELAAAIAKDLGRNAGQVHRQAKVLGLKKVDGWAAQCTRQRWAEGRHENSRKACFPKGNVPANKGVKRPGWSPGRMAETQFQKGRHASESRNYVPIGTEKYDPKRKVLMRKITDDPTIFPVKRWQPVHVLVWKAAGNEIPPGHICIFRPGMKTIVSEEITVDRLEVVSLAENMRRNTFINRYPPELDKLIRANASLKRSITCKERNSNDEEQDGRRARPPVRRTGKPGRPRKADGDRARQGDQ